MMHTFLNHSPGILFIHECDCCQSDSSYSYPLSSHCGCSWPCICIVVHDIKDIVIVSMGVHNWYVISIIVHGVVSVIMDAVSMVVY